MHPVLRQLIYSHLALTAKFQMISLTFAFMVYIMLTHIIGSATFNLPLTPASAAIYGFISSGSYCASVSAACRLSCSFPLRSKRLYQEIRHRDGSIALFSLGISNYVFAFQPLVGFADGDRFPVEVEV